MRLSRFSLLIFGVCMLVIYTQVLSQAAVQSPTASTSVEQPGKSAPNQSQPSQGQGNAATAGVASPTSDKDKPKTKKKNAASAPKASPSPDPQLLKLFSESVELAITPTDPTKYKFVVLSLRGCSALYLHEPPTKSEIAKKKKAQEKGKPEESEKPLDVDDTRNVSGRVVFVSCTSTNEETYNEEITDVLVRQGAIWKSEGFGPRSISLFGKRLELVVRPHGIRDSAFRLQSEPKCNNFKLKAEEATVIGKSTVVSNSSRVLVACDDEDNSKLSAILVYKEGIWRVTRVAEPATLTLFGTTKLSVKPANSASDQPFSQFSSSFEFALDSQGAECRDPKLIPQQNMRDQNPKSLANEVLIQGTKVEFICVSSRPEHAGGNLVASLEKDKDSGAWKVVHADEPFLLFQGNVGGTAVEGAPDFRLLRVPGLNEKVSFKLFTSAKCTQGRDGEKITIQCSDTPTASPKIDEFKNDIKVILPERRLPSEAAPGKQTLSVLTEVDVKQKRSHSLEVASTIALNPDQCATVDIDGMAHNASENQIKESGTLLSVACFDEHGNSKSQDIYAFKDGWQHAFQITPRALPGPDHAKIDQIIAIDLKVLESNNDVYVVNNRRLKDADPTKFLSNLNPPFHVDRYIDVDNCQLYAGDHFEATIGNQPPREGRKANGIFVGPAKIFDSRALQLMLNTTASQLAAISGFDSASIVKAFGSFQGITRDTSFVAGQITTLPTPTFDITKTGDVITKGEDVKSKDSSVEGKVVNDVKGGGVSATVPGTPSSAPLAPPTNVSVASSDILAEQVSLNAQILTLRLLLQGALSDRLLIKNGRAVANRAQTTIGFPITLTPPWQYKHALAEIRIIISPDSGSPGPNSHDPIQIVNLLPSEKTYNVAKVTSHQNQFGAGVVIQPVNAGISTGRSKDRLFLAKDTDTLAFQFPFPADPNLKLGHVHNWTHDLHRTFSLEETRSTCGQMTLFDNSIIFGWQFRPVLGADYVQAGPRQVFAQLSLPISSDEESFAPKVFVQTLWREYNPHTHVTGDILSESCNQYEDRDVIALFTPVSVHSIDVSDAGGGNLKIFADGDFFFPGLNIITGNFIQPPTSFDGHKIEFFGLAKDLLQSNQIDIVGSDGAPREFTVARNFRLGEACRLQQATLTATPRPDGNSTLKLMLNYGKYDSEKHSPLVLIGGKIFGLGDAPFYSKGLGEPGICQPAFHNGRNTCELTFNAPTDLLQKALTFSVKDLAWGTRYSTSGTIEIEPTINGASLFAGSDNSASKTFLLNGTNIQKLFTCSSDCLMLLTPKKTYDLDDLSPDLISSDAVLITVDTDSVKGASSLKIKTGNTLWNVSLAGNTPPDAMPPAPSLKVGDSLEVPFSWKDPAPSRVSFEGTDLISKLDGDKLKVAVTTVVTKIAGQKQLRASLPDGSTKLLLLKVTGTSSKGEE